MTTDLLLFAFGCICAGIGGELFVDGLVSLADRSRIPRGVVAATIGAFATSAPELIVGITAASQGVPEIALGDATGSNVVNIALVLAIPLAVFGLTAPRDSVFRDVPFALALYPIIVLAGLDGRLSQDEAVMLLAVFATWFLWVMVFALRNRSNAPPPENGRSGALLALAGIVGLFMLFLAGQFIVAGATGLAASAGLPPFVIAATVVALGTSVPELATVIIAVARRHHEVGLQTILGSNIFNTLLIVPIAALIHPLAIDLNAASIVLAAGFVATLFVVPVGSLRLGRWRGSALLLLYVSFIAMNAALIW
jgi:cation:H+ antiporter